MLVSAWGSLFFASGPRRLAAYFSGGVWSMVLAAAGEYIIRKPMAYWEVEHTLAAVAGVEVILFIGPRLIEGVLFFQYLPKQTSLQLPAVLFWTLQAVTTDIGAVLTGNAHWSWHSLLTGCLLHLFRFTTLLAIFYGLAYERRAEQLGAISRREARRRWGITLWKLSWIPFYFGVRGLTALLAWKGGRVAERR